MSYLKKISRGSLLMLFIVSLPAAMLPPNFSEAPAAPGVINNATAFEFSPDGRLFVLEQTGAVRVIKNGVLLNTPFATFTVDSNGERGLLGIAFDPNFSVTPYVYFYYTAPGSPSHNQVVRLTANGDVALPNTETLLFQLNDLSTATNHNGGAIHFGPDGKLYVGVGENANGSNSQTLSNLLGKVLRINRDGTIPGDNPYFQSAAGNNRAIWAIGLRNPFTFAFQPGTGRMFINDVGQSTFEEINDGVAGSNYGWPTTEGFTNDPRFRSPLFVYGHTNASDDGCAIAGGAFYNPALVQFPASYVGKYFYADLCTGFIRVFDPSTNTSSSFATGISSPVDLKTGPDGALYYLSRGSGMVFRVVSTATAVTGLRFVPVRPCRVLDTRLGPGEFGGPSVAASATRSVTVPGSGCSIPATAAAYSMNVTVVPVRVLSFLTLWPTGQVKPFVSTLNSLDGRIKANAAIVPAGSNGAISIFVTDTTDVVLDINGYFEPAVGAGKLAFYPLPPCRLADTRNPPGAFGGPALSAAQSRSFTVPNGPCGIPIEAQAYSLNMTAVPSGPLAYLTTWPTGQTQPFVSTLNALTGSVTANAAIVPAGSSGAVSVYATDPTHLVIDINGYFAPPGLPGESFFYPVNPCRLVDTRNTQ
ncbi:MAG: PQQ-dependent sugar dehydrogenase, partial [Bryobacteraceae bacterium]